MPEKAFSVCIKDSVFIDPACGSGSLLLKVEKVLGKDNIERGFYGQEIDLTTYNLCRINMFLHNIEFDKFSIVREDTLLSPQHWDDQPFELIVSNPPYVTAEEMRDLAPELYFEPEIALTDGGDGLSFVRELVRRYTRFVKRGGYLLCEIGSGEGASSLEIAADGGFDAEILKDFSGRDRILSVRV